MENKHIIPRIPLDLTNYDLTGVKLDHSKTAIHHFMKPNINGGVTFVICHRKMAGSDDRRLFTQYVSLPFSRVKNSIGIDHDLFLISIPVLSLNKFISDYHEFFKELLVIVYEITIDTIFDYPIYSSDSFMKLVGEKLPFNCLLDNKYKYGSNDPVMIKINVDIFNRSCHNLYGKHQRVITTLSAIHRYFLNYDEMRRYRCLYFRGIGFFSRRFIH